MKALFPRPKADTLHVEREIVRDMQCPQHPRAAIERYPILRADGWKRVSRCPQCLAVLREEEPASPLGFSYLPPSVELPR